MRVPRDWCAPYLEAERVLSRGTGQDVEQQFARVDFAVTDRALLVRNRGAVLRLTPSNVRSIALDEHVLRLYLEEPSGSALAWKLREPTSWTAELRRLFHFHE